MDEEDIQSPEPKISLVVGILGSLAFAAMDAISFIPGAGDVLDIPALLGLLLSVVFGLGGPIILVQTVVDILKAIPGVQALPLWTPAWLFTCWFENHPSKITKPIQEAIDIAGVAEGDVGELGEEAEAVAQGAAAEAGAIEGASGVTAVEQGSEAGIESGAGGRAGDTEEGGESGRTETRGAGTGNGEATGESGEESYDEAGNKEEADEMASDEEKPWDQREFEEQFENASNVVQFPGGKDEDEEDEESEEEDADDGKDKELPKAA